MTAEQYCARSGQVRCARTAFELIFLRACFLLASVLRPLDPTGRDDFTPTMPTMGFKRIGENGRKIGF